MDVQKSANRANVFLKMEKWAEAEKDCDAALQLKKDHAKVFAQINRVFEILFFSLV